MLLTSTCPVMSLNRKQRFKIWKAGLANCLQRVGAGTMQRPNPLLGNDVLRLIHSNGYLIVPPSNPPTPQQINIPDLSKTPGRNTRGLHGSAKQPGSRRCPFNITVVDFENTVPRHLSEASCHGCDAHCKPVMYTHQVLFKKCGNYWIWTQKTLAVAYVWKIDD